MSVSLIIQPRFNLSKCTKTLQIVCMWEGEPHLLHRLSGATRSLKIPALSLAFPGRQRGAGADQGEEDDFTNDDLHPLTAVLTAQQSTLGQNPFFLPSAKTEPFRKSFQPAAIRLFDSPFVTWWVLLSKVPYSSTSVCIFSVAAPGESETFNPGSLSALLN